MIINTYLGRSIGGISQLLQCELIFPSACLRSWRTGRTAGFMHGNSFALNANLLAGESMSRQFR